MDERIILIYPSGRPDQVVDSINRARSTSKCRIQVVIGLNGKRSFDQIPDSILVDFGEGFEIPGTLVRATNLCYRLAMEAFSVGAKELVGFWSDDFYPKDGWDQVFFNALVEKPSKPFLAILDNLGPKEEVNIPFAPREWWDEKNGKCIWPPMYKRVACDHDVGLRADLGGEVNYIAGSPIRHKHFFLGDRKKDFLDRLGDKSRDEDANLFFNERKPVILKGTGWVTW